MRFKISAILLLLVLIIFPVTAIPWCEFQDLFFLNSTSSISGYKNLDNMPEIAPQYIFTTYVPNTGETLISSWATGVFYNGITIEPSLWRFRTYHDVDSASGVTTVEFKVYNRSPSGSEHSLFYGQAITTDINTLSGGGEYLTSYVRRNYTYLLPGERLVIKMYGATTRNPGTTLYTYTVGNTNASMVSMGYFDCTNYTSPTDVDVMVASQAQAPIGVWVAPVALIAAIAILIRKRE